MDQFSFLAHWKTHVIFRPSVAGVQIFKITFLLFLLHNSSRGIFEHHVQMIWKQEAEETPKYIYKVSFFQNGGSGHLGFKKKASSRISKKKLKFFLLDSYESIEAKKLDSTRDCKVHKILIELKQSFFHTAYNGECFRISIVRL